MSQNAWKFDDDLNIFDMLVSEIVRIAIDWLLYSKL